MIRNKVSLQVGGTEGLLDGRRKTVLTFDGCVGSDQDAQQRVLVHGGSDATLEGFHGVIALNEEGFPWRIGLSVAQQGVRLNLLAQDNLVVTYLGRTEMTGRERNTLKHEW